MTDDTLNYLTLLSDKVKSEYSIWSAIGHLTEALGADAGNHLETLVCKEIQANQPPPGGNY